MGNLPIYILYRVVRDLRGSGGGRRGGGSLGGGGRASRVLSLMFWCSFMYTNKVFFQSLFAFSSLLCCRLLPGEFFTLLCSLAWLALAFFRSGLLCTAELRFPDRFLVRVPTSWECVLAKQEGSLKLCALLGFSILRFFCSLALFCLHALFFGLVCCAPHSIGFLSGLSVQTPTSWELFRKANKWSSWSEKKVLNNLSIFELKKYSCAFS